VGFRDLAVVIDIQASHKVAAFFIYFIEGNLAIAVLIVFCKEIWPGQPGRIAFARGPAREEKQPISNYRCRAGHASDTIHRPLLQTAFKIVTIKANRAGRNYFVGLVIAPDNRCSKTAMSLGTWCFPNYLAGGNVQSNQGRILVLIAIQDDTIPEDDRGRARTEAASAHRNGQRMTPEFFAFEIVSQQAERAEVTDHMTAISSRCGSGWTAFTIVKQFQFLGAHAMAPEHLSAISIGAGLKFAIDICS